MKKVSNPFKKWATALKMPQQRNGKRWKICYKEM